MEGKGGRHEKALPRIMRHAAEDTQQQQGIGDVEHEISPVVPAWRQSE